MISRTRLFFALIGNNEYSGTPLILSPMGQKNLAILMG